MFVFHGNVYDAVVDGPKLVTLTDFLTDVLLKDTRDTIVVMNVATGVRFSKRAPGVTGLEDLLLSTGKDKTLAALERLLIQSQKAAVILEYAETLAPTGDPAFQADGDRAAIVTLHRWSFLPEIERGDNVIILVAENLTDLAPKLVSNPKVATIQIPMPDLATRKRVVRLADPRLGDKDVGPLRGHDGRPEGHPDLVDPRAAPLRAKTIGRAAGVHRGPVRRRPRRGPSAPRSSRP